MKKFLITIIIVAALIFTFNTFKDQIIQTAIDAAATKTLGTEVSIGSFAFKITDQTIDIKDLKIENPKGFPKENFVDIPLIHVNYDLGDILQKKIHLKKLEINLKEFVIIKNKDKKLNVDALAIAQSTEKKDENGEKKAMPMQIDVLVLSLGKIINKDYSAGEEPQIKIQNLGFKNKTYKNITSAEQLTALIITECLKEIGIKSAKMYGAANLLGASFLPAGIAMVLTANNSAKDTLEENFDTTYEAAFKILSAGKRRVTSDQQKNGILKAEADGCNITVKLEKTSDTTTTLTVTAKKLLLSKRQEAEKILYLIKEELKNN